MKKQSNFQSLSIGLNVSPSVPSRIDKNVENRSHTTFKMVLMYLLHHEFFQAADALFMSYTDGFSNEYVLELLHDGLPLILYQSSATRRVPQVVYDVCSSINNIAAGVRASHIGCVVNKMNELLRKRIHYLSPTDKATIGDVFPRIYFRLLCQHFVDLVKDRRCSDALDLAKTLMTPFELYHTGKSTNVQEHLQMILDVNLEETVPNHVLLDDRRKEDLARDVKKTLIAFVFLCSSGDISDLELSGCSDESSKLFTAVMQKLWSKNEVASWTPEMFKKSNKSGKEFMHKKNIPDMDLSCTHCKMMETLEPDIENDIQSTPSSSSTRAYTTEHKKDEDAI